MPNHRNKFIDFSPAIGLIIGVGAAIIISLLFDLNLAITVSIAAGIGLVMGSMVYGLNKNNKKKWVKK